MENIKQQYEAISTFFESNKSKDVAYRKSQLLKLKATIKKYEKDVLEALYKDLGKVEFDAYTTEVGIVYEELGYMINHIHRLARPKHKFINLAHFPSTGFTMKEPYGKVLIMSPWNYPFQLSMVPLLSAVAAGNTVILKPSEFSMHTSAIMEKIIHETFNREHVDIVQGEAKESAFLLSLPFDYIFFTGSTKVGKIVAKAASEHLTPVTLELGGKSPCIVDESANLKLAARRIIWGKLINSGQTCVAPDYVYVKKEQKPALLAYMKQAIDLLYGNQIIKNDDYSRIINERQFDRLLQYIDQKKVCFGGSYNRETLRIEPTIMDNVTWDDAIMQDEIFGPILPILTYEDMDDVIKTIKSKEKPLALYLFTTNKTIERKVLHEVSFGGGCINDTIVHVAQKNLPFGGVGASGMGMYHGAESFTTFSHTKSILKKSNLLDIKLRYPPFKNHIVIVRKVMK